MADTIERTIYKLELDGSAYIAGADKLAASTTKLSDAQTKANQKLAELQKSHNTYKKSLDEINNVLKANEKETIELSKQLNTLKDSEKGASVEADKLRAALRGIAVNTKEFKIEAKELSTNLVATTNQIKAQTKEVQLAEKANTNFAGGLTKVYTGLSRVAALIPGLGIGSLIAIIAGPLVGAFTKWFNALDDVAKRQKILKDITDGAIKSFTGEVVHLGLIREKLNDLNIPQEKRIALAKEYNKTAEEGNKIDLQQIDNIALVNQAIDSQIEKIKQRAFARAAEGIITEKAEALLLAQEEARQKNLRLSNIATAPIPGASTGNEMDKYIQQINQKTFLANQIAKDPRVVEAQKELNDALNIGKEFITIEGLFTSKKDRVTGDKGRKEIANIYEQELQKLKADIAKLDAKGFTDEASITRAVEEDFKKRTLAFDKAFKNKQLTAGQLKSLTGFLNELQALTLAQSLKSFREQRAAYLQKIDNELSNIETQTALKRISNIQDSFERQRQTIIIESDKLIKTKQQATAREIAELRKSTILTPAEIKTAISNVNAATDEFITEVKIHTNQQLQQLSFEVFEKISDDLQRTLKNQNFDVSALALIDIKKQTELYQQGKISYEQYQKELTRIAAEESEKRTQNEIKNLRIEINRRQSELRNNRDLTGAQQEKLLEEIRSREAQIDSLEKGSEKGGVKKPEDDRLTRFVKYTQAVGDLTSQIVSFWQKANEAEAAALDRSISLQEKRVTAAQKIAERGNASYLKAEEDRLKEMQVKRENAARKQLGINAALQGSEILVALISSIAQGVKLGGPLGAIASLAAVVAAVAGAFAIAESLKPPVQTFFTGTKDTGRGGRNDGKGGFTATLHPHEAVLTEKQNKAYKPTVAAIFDGTIPAETLNNFVKNYHQIKSVPLPDYGRIKESAELSIGRDGKMHIAINDQNKLIIENNDLQRATLRALKTIGVNVNMDKNGFAMSIMEVAEQIKINTRV